MHSGIVIRRERETPTTERSMKACVALDKIGRSFGKIDWLQGSTGSTHDTILSLASAKCEDKEFMRLVRRLKKQLGTAK